VHHLLVNTAGTLKANIADTRAKTEKYTKKEEHIPW